MILLFGTFVKCDKTVWFVSKAGSRTTSSSPLSPSCKIFCGPPVTGAGFRPLFRGMRTSPNFSVRSAWAETPDRLHGNYRPVASVSTRYGGSVLCSPAAAANVKLQSTVSSATFQSTSLAIDWSFTNPSESEQRCPRCAQIFNSLKRLPYRVDRKRQRGSETNPTNGVFARDRFWFQFAERLSGEPAFTAAGVNTK